MRWLKFTLLGLVFLLLAAIPLARQIETGSIQGLITNDRGPLAHATVEARHVMSGATFRVESAEDGRYEVKYLKLGRYSLWIVAPGHDAMWIPEVIVDRGSETRRDIHLARSRGIPTGG